MASIVSGTSVGLRKITPLDRETICKEIDFFNMPGSYGYVLEKVLSKKVTGYVAFSGKQIVGFVVFSSLPNSVMKIDALYLRKGFEQKGIGSKLLGKANANAVKTKKSMVFLDAGLGVRSVNGTRKLTESVGFYRKTNYREATNSLIKRFRWHVKPSAKKNVKRK